MTSKSKYKKNFRIKALQTSPFATVLGGFRRKKQLLDLYDGRSLLKKRSAQLFENSDNENEDDIKSESEEQDFSETERDLGFGDEDDKMASENDGITKTLKANEHSKENNETTQNKVPVEWFYDDNDLPNSLTAELLHYQKHFSEFDQKEESGLATTAKYLLNRRKKEKKGKGKDEGRDRRASKNRVLRFEVHEKLMNFLAPVKREEVEGERVRMVLFGEKERVSDRRKERGVGKEVEEPEDVQLV